MPHNRMPRPTHLLIAASLDGYIAAPHDDLSFLSIIEQKGADYRYATLCKSTAIFAARKT